MNDEKNIRNAARELGRRGGLARLTKMTAEQRREIATKASAAAKAKRDAAKQHRTS